MTVENVSAVRNIRPRSIGAAETVFPALGWRLGEESGLNGGKNAGAIFRMDVFGTPFGIETRPVRIVSEEPVDVFGPTDVSGVDVPFIDGVVGRSNYEIVEMV